MTTRPGYIWSGSEWIPLWQEANTAPVSYQDSAPTSPATGDIWIDSDENILDISNSQFLRWRKTAVGGETTLSGADDTGLTLAYTPNYEQVYLNGVLLVRGQDYVATTGTSITGLTALAANDVVEVFGVVARVVGDVYTQAQSDAKYSLQTTTGLVLVTSATIGTSVTSVTVNNCFSSSYDNYLITIAGGSSTSNSNLNMVLGTTTTGYYWTAAGARYSNNTSNFVTGNNVGNFAYVGTSRSSGINCLVTVNTPFLSKNTTVTAPFIADDATYYFSGILADTTSYTGFTISGATLTGGTIKVYGYK